MNNDMDLAIKYKAQKMTASELAAAYVVFDSFNLYGKMDIVEQAGFALIGEAAFGELVKKAEKVILSGQIEQLS